MNNGKHGQGTYSTPNAPNFFCPILLPKPKSLRFQWKKAPLGVRSPWFEAFYAFFQRYCTCSKGIISQLQIIKAWMLNPQQCQFVAWLLQLKDGRIRLHLRVSLREQFQTIKDKSLFSFDVKCMSIELIRFVQLHIKLHVNFSTRDSISRGEKQSGNRDFLIV